MGVYSQDVATAPYFETKPVARSINHSMACQWLHNFWARNFDPHLYLEWFARWVLCWWSSCVLWALAGFIVCVWDDLITQNNRPVLGVRLLMPPNGRKIGKLCRVHYCVSHISVSSWNQSCWHNDFIIHSGWTAGFEDKEMNPWLDCLFSQVLASRRGFRNHKEGDNTCAVHPLQKARTDLVPFASG